MLSIFSLFFVPRVLTAIDARLSRRQAAERFGVSDSDLDDRYRSASWRVMLSEPEYNKVVAYIRKLKARSHFWQATVNNCDAFVEDIARSMGYKTPGIWLRPQRYITKLREMSGGRMRLGTPGLQVRFEQIACLSVGADKVGGVS